MPTDILINSLNRTKDKGIGIDLPIFDGRGSAIKVNYTTLDQAAANAKNLLLTNHNERVMLPTFGCNLYNIMFDNQSDELIEVIKSTISEQFAYWLSYIYINELDIQLDPDYYTLYIKMKISLQNNKFDTKSIDLQITRLVS